MGKKIWVLCTASAFALSTGANAQAPATSGDDAVSVSTDNVIIVTARRRSEDVQDIPLVVNTVTSENIARLNLQNFTEVQSLVPGLQLSTEPTGIGANVQIRGLAFDINASTQPSVEFYLNDAPITSVYVLQQMYDVAQIEVLRGPQGTLRGRSSPSGSIALTTRKADLSEFGGYLSGSASNIGTINFNGAIGIPIIPEMLAVRVAGLINESEGNRVRTIDRDLDGRDPSASNKAGRVSAAFAPLDWLRFEGVYQHADNRSRNFNQHASYSLANPAAPASPLLIRPRDRLSIEETPINVHAKFNVYNWRAEAQLAGQVLIYQGQYADSKTLSINNLDGANYFDKYDNLREVNSSSNTESHELRLQNESRVFGLLDYVVGVFDLKQDSTTNLQQPTPVTLPSFLGGGVVTTAITPIVSSQTIKETAVFGNITAHIGDKFELSGGVRYIHERSPATPLIIAGTALPGAVEVNDKKWIYTASAQYFVTPDFMVYANTGTSYRPGPTLVGNFSLVQSDRQRAFALLDAETSTSYELGFKSSFLDKRGRFNLTGYHQVFKNYPFKLKGNIYYQNFAFVSGAVVPEVASTNQFGASVPVEINGLEGELGFRFSPNFDLSIVASYSKGKIKNGTVPCDDLNGDGVADALTVAPSLAELQSAYGANFVGSCRTNQRSSNLAPFSATVQAEYNYPVSGRSELFTRGLLAFQGASPNDPTNDFDSVGSYGLLNLFAGIRDVDGAWEVNLFAKNVLSTVKTTSFDRPAFTSYQELQPPTFASTAGVVSTSPYSVVNTTPPREFGLNVRYAFGSR